MEPMCLLEPNLQFLSHYSIFSYFGLLFLL
jgi:hypothetical protein